MSRLSTFIKNNYTPYWFTTFGIGILLVLPTLIKDGMFMDGMLYASVSKNLAEGVGTFWFPKFSEVGIAGNTTFHEQPPLVFGIQSLFFKILGNSIYTERIYSFITFLVTAFLIHITWDLIFKKLELRKFSWLPVLSWVIIPICFWSFQNNVHENTMGIFTLLAIYCALKGLIDRQLIFGYFLFSGFFIFLASLCKGVPGLFPISIVGIYWICFGNTSFRKVISLTLILILTPVIAYSLLLLFSTDALHSLSIYLNQRLLGRISSKPTVNSHFWIIQKLFMELIPAIALNAIAVIIRLIKGKTPTFLSTHKKWGLFFILLGCSGSLPLMLTLVQKGFYFAHSLPCFAIGFSILGVKEIQQLTKTIHKSPHYLNRFLVFSVLIFMGSITYSLFQVGGFSRNKSLTQDIYIIGNKIPYRSSVSIPSAIYNDWDLQCTLMRHYGISVIQNDSTLTYLISNLPVKAELYIKQELKTQEYHLYKKVNTLHSGQSSPIN